MHYALSQSCLTLCDLMNCTPPGCSVQGIFQAEILELPFPPPGDLPDPEIRPVFPCLLHCRQILSPLSHLGSRLQLTKLWLMETMKTKCTKDTSSIFTPSTTTAITEFVLWLPWRKEMLLNVSSNNLETSKVCSISYNQESKPRRMHPSWYVTCLTTTSTHHTAWKLIFGKNTNHKH